MVVAHLAHVRGFTHDALYELCITGRTDDETACTTCYTSLTVNHILIECPQLNHLCQQYHFGSTLRDLFNTTSVNDVIAFIKDTHLNTRI